MKEFIQHQFENKDSATFRTASARYHFGLLSKKADFKLSYLYHRRLDRFFLKAVFRVMKSYFANLISPNNGLPYYAFSIGKVQVGKYITSSVQRHRPSTITNKFSFLVYFHIGLFRSSFVYGSALRKSSAEGGIHLGDPWYLDGIVLDLFLQKPGTVVYLDIFPFGLVCVPEPVDNLSAAYRLIYTPRSQGPTVNDAEVSNYMKRRLENPNSALSYYQSSSEDDLAIDVRDSEQNFIIYAHSFTDTQMALGYDGFKNVYDWIVFTLERILSGPAKSRVWIKAHPNFFPDRESDAAKTDRVIWSKLVKRFEEYVEVIDSKATNYDVLRQFETSKTLLISHHGNALIEGAWMGFSSVSSGLAEWATNYTFSETWLSREEYSEILSTASAKNLDSTSKENVRRFIWDFYMNEELVDLSKSTINKLVAKRFSDLSEREKSASGWPSSLNFSEYELEHLRQDFAAEIKTLDSSGLH